MQLVLITTVVFVLLFVENVKAQISKFNPGSNSNLNIKENKELSLSVYEKPDWKTIDVDFLSSYYAQDGNNSAVTGGIGTEQLSDFTQKISLRIPVNPKLTWNLSSSYDYYSSASTDNIDNIKSSDSSSDIRTQINSGIDYMISENSTLGINLGASKEYDYSSIMGALSYTYLSDSGNTSFGINTQVFIDDWVLYYPKELRGEVKLNTDKRQSYNLGLSVNQVISQKTQINLVLEGVYMKGLLSTPFHRVYFKDISNHSIERLPNSRLKFPLGLRINSQIHESIVLRSYFRYYVDSWGINAITGSIEVPIKINRFFAVYPYYRFHNQSAADYFYPYQEGLSSSEFYTSDYDLANLSSHQYGFGVLYSPPGGLFNVSLPLSNINLFRVDGIELKFGMYKKSNQFNAQIISLGIKLKI